MAALDFKSLASEPVGVASEPLGERLPSNSAPEVVALQAVAIVDHVCAVTSAQLGEVVGNESEIGGSRRVDLDAVSNILGDALRLASTAAFFCSNGGFRVAVRGQSSYAACMGTASVGEFHSKAGGSAANTLRGALQGLLHTIA